MQYVIYFTDVVRTLLPNVIPPSYKGATIRYLYYIRSTISGQWLILENPHSRGESVKDLTELVGFQFSSTRSNCFLTIYLVCTFLLYFHSRS